MRYRYLTSALAGEWRKSADEACADAIRARQADRIEDGSVQWRSCARLDVDPSDGKAPAKRAF